MYDFGPVGGNGTLTSVFPATRAFSGCNPMASWTERARVYRAKAEECMCLAQSATSPAQRAQYLDLAAHWHTLAVSTGWDDAPASTQTGTRGIKD